MPSHMLYSTLTWDRVHTGHKSFEKRDTIFTMYTVLYWQLCLQAIGSVFLFKTYEAPRKLPQSNICQTGLDLERWGYYPNNSQRIDLPNTSITQGDTLSSHSYFVNTIKGNVQKAIAIYTCPGQSPKQYWQKAGICTVKLKPGHAYQQHSRSCPSRLLLD